MGCRGFSPINTTQKPPKSHIFTFCLFSAPLTTPIFLYVIFLNRICFFKVFCIKKFEKLTKTEVIRIWLPCSKKALFYYSSVEYFWENYKSLVFVQFSKFWYQNTCISISYYKKIYIFKKWNGLWGVSSLNPPKPPKNPKFSLFGNFRTT